MSSLFEKLGADILARMFEVAAHGLALVDTQGRFLHINARGCAILGYPYAALTERRLGESVVPHQRDDAERWFRASLRGDIGNFDLSIQVGGREREVSAFCVPVSLERQQVGLIALHDVTESRRAEREARALGRIVSSLTLKTSVYDIAETIAQGVVETTEGVACAVVLAGGEPARVRVVGHEGFLKLAGKEIARLVEAIVLTQGVLKEPRPVVIHNLEPASASLPLLKSLVSVPLVYRGRHIGALFSFFPSHYQPEAGNVDYLQAIADQSVLAIENAQLFSAVQEKAALEERARLARELHDSVSQALYGIALAARSARSQLEPNPERVSERLDYVLKLAEAAITEMRALIFELRPETLASEGLVMALSKQAAALKARHHLEVDTTVDEEPELPLAAKEALYRIAQEALHNVVKHARARKVSLALKSKDPYVTLEIGDDGVGFNPNESFPGHLGLRSMRERAELLGGSFILESEPGKGTRLHVELPQGRGA